MYKQARKYTQFQEVIFTRRDKIRSMKHTLAAYSDNWFSDKRTRNFATIFGACGRYSNKY